MSQAKAEESEFPLFHLARQLAVTEAASEPQDADAVAYEPADPPAWPPPPPTDVAGALDTLIALATAPPAPPGPAVPDALVLLEPEGMTTLSELEQASPSLTIAPITLTGDVTLDFGEVGGLPGDSSSLYDVDLTGVLLDGFSFFLVNGAGDPVDITLLFSDLPALNVFRVKCNTDTVGLM